MASPLRAFPIIGHRGAPLLEPPGNTLVSLLRAVEAGAEMLEVDVRRTRDDVLILDHENVHLLDGEEVPLRDRSFSQWRQHGGDWGQTLLTLEEVFALALEAEVGLMLDFKEPGTEGMVARAIRKSQFPLSSLLVAGAGETSRRILRGLDPRIPLSLTLDMDEASIITPQLLLELDTEAVTWHHRLLTPQIVDILHRRDILVYAWTVDLTEDMRRMVEVCHVDGIITNSPDMLKAIIG
jgi:glycerophosphoryl diester phosphodiesterase